jgi:ATP-binding cassette, subfamily F, member 3
VRLGHGVEAAYFSQHDVELDERGSVLDCAVAMTGLRRPDAQNLLGRFLFSGWDTHEKAVAVLSGGERRRLALACLVAGGANFLVLDEPTNHLDLESREALEQALEAFPGTVLLVSHDRALLDAVAHRLLGVEERRLVSSDGGWADYVRTREERNTPTPAAVAAPKAKPKAKAKPARPKQSPIELIEAEIARAEQRVTDLEQKLADDWTDVELLAAHRSARDDLQALLGRWERLFEQAGA